MNGEDFDTKDKVFIAREKWHDLDTPLIAALNSALRGKTTEITIANVEIIVRPKI